MERSENRILIGSPIQQKPRVLRHFLEFLLRLNHQNIAFSYVFIDDNTDLLSKRMLAEFALHLNNVSVIDSNESSVYVRSENTHYWNDSLIWKVAEFKNQIIAKALEQDVDYLFLVDSDLLLHPQTIQHLINQDKDIVSEIFWTRWTLDSDPLPQVWLRDQYTLYRQSSGETLSDSEKEIRLNEFLAQMKVAGVYEVGGLGACTLISRKAIRSGVNFKEIKNLSLWGEDRHFCVRAQALGLHLFVDTQYPALHLYRESDLDNVDAFRQQTQDYVNSSLDTFALNQKIDDILNYSASRPKLTLSMIIRNEENRFLRQVLEKHKAYIDEAVIIDDGSTDRSIDICKEILDGIPLKLVCNQESMFHNETELRQQQWNETIKTNPDWILILDADEIFEDRFASEVRSLIGQSDIDLICFRLYDFWDENHYREDNYWYSHRTFRPFLMRYREDFTYWWKKTPQHCGRFPENIFELPHGISTLRLKHLGWSKEKFRLEKFNRYMELDPEYKYGWREQYLSILEEDPHLVEWIE
ncbi:glycosyltransferase [Paenibacillus whitsoniae]|uniref:Glycosyltransferase n=1 Tax=Paenibacillus whitsoniae TaxID=2496558 RepID=A0A430J415_9BACL|nr:glycosyltransferase [Paenibacillus whitsoniae]RTE01327.1 glycosyltransferase [Paenibacillus whitsoniae]